MKTKDKKALHAKTLQELRTLLKEGEGALFLLKLDKQQNKLKNPRSIFSKRKEIARILTIIRGKEFESAKNI